MFNEEELEIAEQLSKFEAKFPAAMIEDEDFDDDSVAVRIGWDRYAE